MLDALITFVKLFGFIIFVNSCNVYVFCICTFSTKLDLLETTCSNLSMPRFFYNACYNVITKMSQKSFFYFCLFKIFSKENYPRLDVIELFVRNLRILVYSYSVCP
jgi:hypothetical protein